jgi:ferredoxin
MILIFSFGGLRKSGRDKMKKSKVYAVSNLITLSKPIEFGEDICNGCNICVEACQIDVFLPNARKGKPPFFMFPDGCFLHENKFCD